jgi:hypothetical protein
MSDLKPFNAFKNINVTWHDCNLSIERELDNAWNRGLSEIICDN